MEGVALDMPSHDSENALESALMGLPATLGYEVVNSYDEISGHASRIRTGDF